MESLPPTIEAGPGGMVPVSRPCPRCGVEVAAGTYWRTRCLCGVSLEWFRGGGALQYLPPQWVEMKAPKPR